MKQFAELIQKIEQTKSTKNKVRIIQNYFEKASSEDSAWAVYFLCGNKLKRLIGPSKLFEWCIEAVGLPVWLVEESYSSVGDLAETIALLMDKSTTHKDFEDLSLSQWINEKILPLSTEDKEVQKAKILEYWNNLDSGSIFILNKLLTGSLRIGVSQLLTIDALSKTYPVSKETLNQRLMGSWEPSTKFFESLKSSGEQDSSAQFNPYPFYLASPIQGELEKLGDPKDWTAEWKWDGIRAQSIIRNGEVVLWSRGNELISHQFPEIVEALKKFKSNTILDGEILAYKDGRPLSFMDLQQRLGRKKPSRAVIEKVPIVFMIYDVLEYDRKDLRKENFSQRRALIETFEGIDPKILISPKVNFQSWNDVELKRLEAHSNSTEGLILKRNESPYLPGRKRGHWWKYKIDPKSIDAVLIYAQPGHGWRANLYTDYTFGVWHESELVPITKAYSGLSLEEIKKLDTWIRRNTLEKFGPVRKVKAEQVFEIAFEGIQRSARHKSGVAFRFPRILRWRDDKPVEECDTLEGVIAEFL